MILEYDIIKKSVSPLLTGIVSNHKYHYSLRKQKQADLWTSAESLLDQQTHTSELCYVYAWVLNAFGIITIYQRVAGER